MVVWRTRVSCTSTGDRRSARVFGYHIAGKLLEENRPIRNGGRARGRSDRAASRTRSIKRAPGVVSRLGDLHAVRFEGDAVGVRSAAHSGVERVDRGYLLAGELEVEDVEILGDAGGLGRLRDRGSALLQVPAQHHLSGRLAVLARDLKQRR